VKNKPHGSETSSSTHPPQKKKIRIGASGEKWRPGPGKACCFMNFCRQKHKNEQRQILRNSREEKLREPFRGRRPGRLHARARPPSHLGLAAGAEVGSSATSTAQACLIWRHQTSASSRRLRTFYREGPNAYPSKGSSSPKECLNLRNGGINVRTPTATRGENQHTRTSRYEAIS
jgi:hypothetical protein